VVMKFSEIGTFTEILLTCTFDYTILNSITNLVMSRYYYSYIFLAEIYHFIFHNLKVVVGIN